MLCRISFRSSELLRDLKPPELMAQMQVLVLNQEGFGAELVAYVKSVIDE
jgi:hypothetical protein